MIRFAPTSAPASPRPPMNTRTGPVPRSAGQRIRSTEHNLDHQTVPPARPSPREALRCRRELARALEAVARRRLIPASSVVWPRGLDLGLVRELRLPLHQQNALLAGRALGEIPGDGRPLTARHLHSLTGVGFGPRQLVVLLRALEDWLIESSRSDGSGTGPARPGQSAVEPRAPDLKTPSATRDIPSAWKRAGARLRPILEMAALFDRARTLKDLLRPDLRTIASQLRQNPELDGVRVADLLGPGRSPLDRLRARADEAIEDFSAAERLVTRRRLLRPGADLEDVGRHLGGDAATARAVETRVRRKLTEAVRPRAAEIGRVLRQVLGPVCDPRDLESALCRLLPAAEAPLSDLLRDVIRDSAGYAVHEQICLDEDARRLASAQRAAVRRLACDAGLIPEDRLPEALPTPWIPRWPHLLPVFGLHDVDGHAALRPSPRARAKAALLNLERPATSAEIAMRAGLSARTVNRALSGLASVTRAHGNRWMVRPGQQAASIPLTVNTAAHRPPRSRAKRA